MSVVFGLLKMSFWVPEKGQLSLLDRRYKGLRFSANGQKIPNKFENTQVPLE